MQTVANTDSEPAPGQVGELVTCSQIESPSRAAEYTRVAPLSLQRYGIQFALDQAGHDLLRQVQDLLGHEVPRGDLAEVIVRALQAYAWRRAYVWRCVHGTQACCGGRGARTGRCGAPGPVVGASGAVMTGPARGRAAARPPRPGPGVDANELPPVALRRAPAHGRLGGRELGDGHAER